MSKIKLDVGENKDAPKLENVRIKDREMIPEIVISYTSATETITDNDKNVVGFNQSFVKNTTITLRPEEFYKNGSDVNAKEDGKST